ncbi:hypothetical protein CCS01_00885 [Rhodopila globiformis]|uniref:Host attachment protein n=1 Tax=Rhodopila globiformis TaxID=1071 RepID=A0A2S6NP51_RHOGL|nr:hypothetical protein CCS01_00885 [Rhodopila globiformis]
MPVAIGAGAPTAPRRPAEPGGDRPGTIAHSHAPPGYAPPGHDPHMLETETFAKVVGGQLNAAARRQDFDDLILVAPPRTLKTIHDTLDAATRERVILILEQDLMRTSAQDLLLHVEAWMFRCGDRVDTPSE